MVSARFGTNLRSRPGHCFQIHDVGDEIPEIVVLHWVEERTSAQGSGFNLSGSPTHLATSLPFPCICSDGVWKFGHVDSLPQGYEKISLNGQTYYVLDGIYYQARISKNGEVSYEAVGNKTRSGS